MAFAHHKAGNSAFYTLPKGATILVGTVGIFTPENLQALGVPPKPGAPLTFEILVDGRLAWRSPPLDKRDSTADLELSFMVRNNLNSVRMVTAQLQHGAPG